MRKFVLPAALACGLAACSEAPSAPPAAAPPRPTPASFSRSGDPIPGQYIVQFRPSSTDALTNAKYVERTMGGVTTFVYTRVLNGAAIQLSDDAAAALRSDPRVLSVDQDQVVSINTTQNNPPSWGLDRIDQRNLPLSLTYSYGLTGSGVTAYIIDTGLNFAQTDFGGRASAGIDEITPGGGSVDCAGHGTHTAGTVGSATYGVAKGVKIVAVRVLDCTGTGSFAGVIAGIDWVTAHATLPAVASMSLGGPNFAPLDTSVAHSIAAGIPYVVAAGNSSANACLSSPGNTPGTITIGATSITDGFASFSDRGPCVALNAPGVNITSLWIGANGATSTISGTSMATPHVSGVVALYLQANPTATPAQVRAALIANATPNVISSVPANTPNLLLYSGFLNIAPIANFTSNCNGLACSFDGSGSTALSIATYSWTFGDATSGTGKTPNHTYAVAGTYVVALTVTDPNGTSVKTSSVNVGGAANQPPVAKFTLTCPTLHCSADGSSSTDDVGIVQYTWAWGDGRTESHVGSSANNTWAVAGVYNVSLTVRDGGGLTNTLVKQVTIPTPVQNQSPTATITVPTNNGSFVQGTAVTFTGSGQDPEDGALTGGSLVWTSNVDGQIGTGTTFNKSNLSVGPHTITLKATDSQAAFGNTSVQITITAVANQPPTATITAPTNNGSFVQGTPVTFTGSGQDPEDGALTGGSLVWTSNVDGQIGTGTSFGTSGLSVGPHTITLKATDSQAAFGTALVQITITAANQPPVANFTWTCSGAVPHQCSVDGSSSTDDHGIVRYTWDWGNGRSEGHVGATSTNTWATGGVFNVTLTVRDAGGLTNAIIKAVTVP
jgi:PKD repeat protein